jgi:hypothetical protein
MKPAYVCLFSFLILQMVAMRMMIQANEQANNPERIPTTIKALAFKKVVVLLLKKINNKKSDIKHYKNT